jgi:tetraacyldisaccharide 4'-kinase
VIVAGNLTVGGTGKTPLVLWLAGFLRRQGRRPGIVTRGYGGGGTEWPRLVTADSDPFEVGDEPVLLARRSGCPVVAGPDRVAAGEMLVGVGGCDMIVSDDGLQHYRLERDLEILVVDASRGFGNGRCLPAGPLREPALRRRGVDLTVCTGGPCSNGRVMRLVPGNLVNLRNRGISRSLGELRRQRVTAVAGIGNPDRFFRLLRRHGLHLDERPYPDHYRFSREDAASWPPGPVIMTEKDAVKCERFARPDHWYLPVEAELDSGFERSLLDKLKGIGNG